MATKKKTTRKSTKSPRAGALPYVIIRATQAGVHAGELVSEKGQRIELRNARRIWYWKGAASLSELAVYGAKSPSECRFGAKITKQIVLDACEIIHCQPAGAKMIRECAEWRA